MAKKQPVVAHLADKAARAKRQRPDHAKALVSTAKASTAKAARTVAPAPVPKAQVDVGGTHHLFVNLPPGALFVWDKAANLPGIYVKWSPHFFRRLNALQPGYINESNSGIRCFHIPEKEVVDLLKDFQ